MSVEFLNIIKEKKNKTTNNQLIVCLHYHLYILFIIYYYISLYKDILTFLVGGIATGLESKSEIEMEDKKEVLNREFGDACIVCIYKYIFIYIYNCCYYFLFRWLKS